MSAEGFREVDDIGVLRDAVLFQNMPESVIRTILLQAETVRYSAGQWVVRRGEKGNRLFVVKNGVVEVVSPAEGGEPRPLAYLGRGECIGELAILTDSPRNADVRVPEHAELIVIGKDLFEDLLNHHASFGAQLSVILAHRLVHTLQNLPDDSSKKELQGSLRYFDLATVIQTLITSSQSGVMKLQIDGETRGTLSFHAGNIAQACFEHRRGDEAIHQLFQTRLDGEFYFSSTQASEEGQTDPNITVPAMALVLESVRLQDELAALQKRLPPSDALLERTETQLSWTEPTGKEQAEQIWEQLATPKRLQALLETCTGCHYHAAVALEHLLQTEQVMPALQ